MDFHLIGSKTAKTKDIIIALFILKFGLLIGMIIYTCIN